MTTAVIQTFPCNSPLPSQSRRRNLDPAWGGGGRPLQTPALAGLFPSSASSGCEAAARSAPGRMGGELQSVAGLQAAAPVGRRAALGGGDESCSGDTENRRDLLRNLWYAAETLQTPRSTWRLQQPGTVQQLQDPDYHFKGFNSRISSPPPRPPSSFQQKYCTF